MASVRVTRVLDKGLAVVEDPSGVAYEVRCAQHIGIEWLRAAVAVAPIEAAVLISSSGGRAGLVAVFPDEIHQDVEVDLDLSGKRIRIRAAEALEVCSGRSSMTLAVDGEIRIQGKNLLSRAAGLNVIKGGSIRMN